MLVARARSPAPSRTATRRRSPARSSRACARSTRTCCSAGTSSTSTCACSRRAATRSASRRTLGRVPGDVRFQEDRGFTRQTRARDPGPHGARRHRARARRAPARRLPARDGRAGGARPRQAARSRRARRRRARSSACTARIPTRSRRTTARTRVSCSTILEHEGLLALAVERSLLPGMQLDRVGAIDRVASICSICRSSARARLRRRRASTRAARAPLVQGGALLEPVPGLPRRRRGLRLQEPLPEPDPHLRARPARARAARAADGDVVEAPNGARFARERRDPAGRRRALPGAPRGGAASAATRTPTQAIKIMLNALFGVLGATACRFFDPAVANAITASASRRCAGRATRSRRAGVRVLYGDTDSVFVQARRAGATSAEPLRARVERAIAERDPRASTASSSRLELEFEHVFERLFLPRVRGGRGAAQQALRRVAGEDGAPLVVVGLEAVRRDWPRRRRAGCRRACSSARSPTARSLPFVRDVVAAVRARRARRRARLREARAQGVARPLHGDDAAARPGGAQGRARARAAWSAT